MKTTIKTEKNIAQLEIEIEREKLEEGINLAFEKNKKKIAVPGFRKGKAPGPIAIRYYGEEVFYNEAIEIIFPTIYDEVVKQNDIFPVDRPEIEVKQIGKDVNLIISAKVTIKPEVTLGQYKDIEVEKTLVEITNEDVDNKIQADREGNARIVPAEDRPTQLGDIVTIDFEGFMDGTAFEGGKGANYELTLGSGQFIPGFEDQLIDRNIDDNIDVNLTFPKEYHAEQLAGKPALFKVKIKLIQTKELPELDDEFAQEVSEFDTLEEYKNSIKDKLLADAQQKSDDAFKDAILNKIIENSTIDLPQVMINNQLNNIIQNFDARLRGQGYDLQTYLNATGTNYNDFLNQYTPRAEKEVRMQLVIEKIGKVENINPSSEDFDNEVKSIAKSINRDENELKNNLTQEDIAYINNTVTFNKTIKFLVDNNKAI